MSQAWGYNIPMAACDQCGKPAVFNVDGHPICVDCNLKIQQAFQIRDTAIKQQINFFDGAG
jgi:hypothetical protein